jgi:hypothetical protein
VPLAVDHDQETLDARVIGALDHLTEIEAVVGLVLEERVDVFDSPKVQTPGNLRKPEMVELLTVAPEARAMERPLRQRNFEERSFVLERSVSRSARYR